MMPEAARLSPDFDAAQAFLTLLDETAEAFTFQTFDDDKRRKDRALANVLSGDFDALKDTLAALNARGAGVFVTVNETDLKGRRIENINRVRAVWHEDDHGAPRAFPLQPQITVESSPGKFHRYWLAAELALDDFRDIMAVIVHDYGSDPNAKDAARVLRLPGFLHLKDPKKPFLVRVTDESLAQPYAATQLLRAFQSRQPTPDKDAPPEDTTARLIDKDKLQEIRSALSFIDPTDREAWLQAGMALHSLGSPNQSFGLWDEWSQKTHKGNYDPVGQRRTWDSFGKRTGRLTTMATLFEMAKRAGWVKPSLPRRPASVTDIRGENAVRLDYERRIREAEGDQGELLYVLTPEILASSLREATKALLLKLISESTGVSVGALRADGPRRPRSGDDDAFEQPEKFIPALNERHAVVPVGGRVLILNREYDPALRRPLLTFSARSDFITRYENRSVRKGGEDIDVGTYWLKSPKRRQHDGLVFMPGGEVPGYYNLWTGWGVQPKPGRCGLFLSFLRDVICGGCDQRAAYVWGWLAHLFQRPQELPGTCLVLRGKQGVGKNRFAEAIGRLVGAHFIALSSLNQVAGRFSGHLADVLLVFANEAIWGGDKSAEGALKSMITDPYSVIEAKGKDIRSCANYKRLIVASNEDWVVPRGKSDRRFVVLDVSDRRKEDRDYFAALMAELKAGGYSALMHALMTADISHFEPSRIPEVARATGWELAVRSGNSMERWWFDVLQRGYLYYEEPTYAAAGEGESGHLWPKTIECERIQGMYLKWSERHRVAHPESVETLGGALRQFGLRRVRPRAANRRVWAYELPDMDIAREVYGQLFGIPPEKWESDDA